MRINVDVEKGQVVVKTYSKKALAKKWKNKTFWI
jgi:hypothetical protein